jgi:hypothetical protein
MASVANVKAGSAFSEQYVIEEVTYDFAVDLGATGALNLFTAEQDMVIHKVVAKVKTAVTSGGSATVEVGKSGDTAGLVAQTGKASLTAGVVIDSKIGGYKLASGAVIIQTIATAALTAGKITYEIHYSKF